MTVLTSELLEAVRQAKGEPVRVEDPHTHTRYAIVPEEVYDRVKSLLRGDSISKVEQLAYLSQLGKITGWDDPEMDIYDDRVENAIPQKALVYAARLSEPRAISDEAPEKLPFATDAQ